MKKKPTVIIKYQHGGKFVFHYESISEAAKALNVAFPTIWKAYYCQHKCRTFEVKFETKKNFDVNKFV